MVEYTLSGVIEARVGGSAVTLGGPKQRCVLAVLLADHGSIVSVDRLIDCVWGDAAPPKAPVSLRSYIANLRRILNAPDSEEPGGQRVESHPHGYRLVLLPGDTVDMHQFEELVSAGRTALRRSDPGGAHSLFGEAMALWRGDPFGEFAYHDFAAPTVRRLTALRASATEARLDAGLRLGAGIELVPDIEAALAQNPTAEALWGHLMLALHRAGRGADAVRAFDRACATLRHEIGSTPGTELQELFDKITDDAAELRIPPVGTETASRTHHLEPPALVGRSAELRVAAAGVHQVRSGIGGFTLILGESGIGKTSLASAVANLGRAEDNLVTWAAHPSGVGLPQLWTWIQVLRQLGIQSQETTRRAVCRAAPGVVEALVPEWNCETLSVPVPATGFALAEGIVIALGVLASVRPLVIVLDDLHLADDASLAVLSVLMARFPHIPIQVVGCWTYYGTERPVNREGFQGLLRAKDTTAITLGGIDRQAALQLIDGVVDSPASAEISEQLWRQADGNPFYIKELARAFNAGAASNSVPETVVGLVGARLSELEPLTRRTLGAGAVVGPEFDVADLSDIIEMPISAVQKHLWPAFEAGLIDEVAERPGAYRFSHGLLREAILVQLPPTERTGVHAAVATANAAALLTAPYEHGIAAADHAWRAGADLSPATGLEIHETVIQRALARSAYVDVATLSEHALQICHRLPAKPELLERQATLWLHLASAKGILDGQASESAKAAVQRAFEIGHEVQGRSFYSAAAVQCMMLGAHGRLDECEVIVAGLRDQFDRFGDADAGVAGDFTQVMVHALRGDVEAMIDTGRHMMDHFPPPETVSDPMHFFHPRVYCWMALGEALRGDRRAMRDYAERALRLAQSRGDVFNILAAKFTVVESAAILGDLRGTAAAAASVDRDFAAAGGPQWAAAARIVSVWAQILESGEGDAEPAFQAFEMLTMDGTCVMNAFFLALLADIEKCCGRAEHAHELLVRARTLSDATGEHAWDSVIDQRLAAFASPPVRTG
ncbi:MAG: AAA family ATPase [Mycobacterium sp.]|nr:AAA family ATPase [Mycobacterium sp.]